MKNKEFSSIPSGIIETHKFVPYKAKPYSCKVCKSVKTSGWHIKQGIFEKMYSYIKNL